MKYSEIVLKHFDQPLNAGAFDSADKDVGVAFVGTIGNGDVIQFHIRAKGDRIIAAKFKVHGSCPTIATASYLSEWVKGKSLQEAENLRAEEILAQLELPQIKLYCVILVEEALKKAVENLRHKL